ncbi:Uncharacterized protein Rs2_50177 [Raphanus sativus]|nr:Uncharacterized protein Rs2_50177 [Raphanus sativus]
MSPLNQLEPRKCSLVLNGHQGYTYPQRVLHVSFNLSHPQVHVTSLVQSSIKDLALHRSVQSVYYFQITRSTNLLFQDLALGECILAKPVHLGTFPFTSMIPYLASAPSWLT